MEYTTQVSKEHYSFSTYFFLGRWVSYWHQTKEIAERVDIATVLDIGPGTAFLKDVLTIHRPDIRYETLDIAKDVLPDHIGGITDIPLQDEQFDAVCAFQVLEHIEYKDVSRALAEMKRVSKKYVFISLPHFGPSVELSFKLPFMRRRKWSWKIPYAPQHIFKGQHYWELGKRGYSAGRVRQLLEEQFTIITEYIPFENQYHHFYIMEKK